MSITISLLPWPFNGRGWESRMHADADRLLAAHGDAAYGTAADLAWREDMGLLHAPFAGHWSRVTLEIGRRAAAAEPDTAVSRPLRGTPSVDALLRAA